MDDKSELLDSLPDRWELKKLSEFFAEWAEIIKQYFGYTPHLLQNIQEKGLNEVEDTKGFLIFGKEGTAIIPFDEAVAINPKELLINLRKALRVLSSGRGIDPYFSGDFRAADLSRDSYMVLVYIEGTIYPALDWREEEVVQKDAKTVTEWIAQGRQNLEDEAKPKKGGWGGWA